MKTVAIVGRPNVGKSTLFNRLLGRRRALVHDLPGVTRDRLQETAEWWVRRRKVRISLVDTGGLGGERFGEEIARQVEIALREADAVIVVFDAQTGLTPADRDVVRLLQRQGLDQKAPIIAAVNKIDVESHEALVGEFFAAGLDPVLGISAEHDRGIDELREAVVERIGIDSEEELEPGEEKAPRIPKIAVVGRPNVGKSTFVNAVLRQERMITSPIAGTTVDAVDTLVHLDGKPAILIDTAGIRRKSKTEKGVEVLSVVQARKALERCDVAVLILDGEKGVTDQDEKIGGLIEEVGCSVILAINKWDTQRKNPKFTKEMAAERIRRQMAYLRYAPILFMSALEGKGMEDLGDLVDEILNQRQVKVGTHEFSEWVRRESEIHNPRNAKFYLCHQTSRNPPTFVCHVNDPEKVHFSLKRHLVNALRERWGYMGTPVRLHFVPGHGKKKERHDQARARR